MFIAFSTLIASAQFMVTTTINQPADSTEWGMSNFTNNMGIGYNINERILVGVAKNGEDFDFFGRCNVSWNMYLFAQAPMEEMFDNMKMGVGYSFRVFKGFSIEPNYSINLKDEEGDFNFGLSYQF